MTSDPAFDHGPSFSPDGRWIYFTSTRTGTYRIWRMPADGGEATPITNDEGFVHVISPDGTYLYYSGASVGASQVKRMPVDGGASEKILDGVLWWSFDVVDRGIYYIDGNVKDARLVFLDFSTGASRTIATNVGMPAGGFTAKRDGTIIMFSRTDSLVDDLMLVERFR